MNRKIAFVPRHGYFAMPASYDPAKVTREDIARDAAICQATAELTVLRRESKALSDTARETVSDASEYDLSALDAIDEQWADALAALNRDDLSEARAYLTLAQTYAARWGSSMPEDKALAMLAEVA